jgi:hypothetical protein
LAKLSETAMDVGLDGSDGLAGGDRYLFVSETDHVAQHDCLAGAGREGLEPPMPGVEVDIVRVI